MKLTLQQIKDLHKAEGCEPLSVKVHGHIDLVVKNEDGSIDQVVSKTNLATNLWNDFWHGQSNLRQLIVFILPDDNAEMHPFRTAARHLYSSNFEIASYSSLNSATNTWTYSAVLNPPSSNRTIRYIGLRAGDIQQDANSKFCQAIFAMTRLTSNITQTTTQTLEIIYRVTFSRA